jgi:hypothetical protein
LTEQNLFFRKFDLVSDLFYPMFTTSLLKEKEITKTCPPRQPLVATPQEGN